jgi:hypothetical protein
MRFNLEARATRRDRGEAVFPTSAQRLNVTHSLRFPYRCAARSSGLANFPGHAARRVVLTFAAVEDADPDPPVHEVDVRAGPGRHLVAVAATAHVDVGLTAALAPDHGQLGDAAQLHGVALLMMWAGPTRPIVLDAGQKSPCVDRENDRNIG